MPKGVREKDPIKIAVKRTKDALDALESVRQLYKFEVLTKEHKTKILNALHDKLGTVDDTFENGNGAVEDGFQF